MLHAYRHTGGLAHAREVFMMFKIRHGSDSTRLARWIVKRNVMSFDWQSKIWVPLFQFNLTTMTLHPELHPIFAALNPVFEAWEMAYWFTQPNRWLADCTPVDTFSVDAKAVLGAACANRFT